jgi:ERF superfamily
MHRSSESVAAIATALAKAQTELSNPEKAMVGTVYNIRSDSPQSFRYASLSSGLDIIRKTLGGQQIAIAQTTDIDRANGTVNLTTVLLHTSGEWISSDWPICQISETSAPRRMGAALTYARRYALFTMVGIAGEDDLDAPDITNDQPNGDKAAEARLAPNSGLESAPIRSSQFRTGNPNPPVREKLDVEESAAIAAQLIREIETPPEGELQLRAIAILKAKNRLSADDAKRVEDAFAARMSTLGGSLEALTTDEPASTSTDPAPPQAPAAPAVPSSDQGTPQKG